MSTATARAFETNAPEIAKVGQPAPDFDLPSTKNIDTLAENVKLADYKGKWLILLFYPLDFTFVCPTEMIAFSDRLEEFKALDCEVIGISGDSKFTHLAWTRTPRNQGGIEGNRLPLLADIKREMSRRFGVLTDDGVALRGLFLLDPDGIIQHATINNLSVGRSIDETLRLLQAYQFSRESGDVCPANWQPGDETIEPNIDAAAEYFAAV